MPEHQFFFQSFLGGTEQTEHWVNPWVHTALWLSELGHKSQKTRRAYATSFISLKKKENMKLFAPFFLDLHVSFL